MVRSPLQPRALTPAITCYSYLSGARHLRISLITKLTIGTSLILLVFMVFFAYINIATFKTMLMEAAISDADKLSETIIKTTHYEMLEDNRQRAYQMIQGVLDTIVSLESMQTLISYYRNRIIVLTIFLLLSISFTIIFFTHRLVNRPVKKLLTQTTRITRGDFDVLVNNTSRDEMGELSDAFNQMTASLKSARMELEEWGKNLEAKVAERTSEIKQMQTQLIRSEKLVSLGRLVAGITHEINNPLTGILMFANLIHSNPKVDLSLKNDTDVIINEAKRCAKIVKGLLDFSRESIPQKKPASLSQVMEGTLALIGRQSSFLNIDIVRDYQPDLPLIPIDEDQIEQVFINMLLNASQSMPEGGTITITTYTDKEEYACLKITDTGIGIAEENMEKIFDPFFTTKSDKGTGLGLSVSYGIIERHGGKIEVQSKMNEGTTFVIKLPLDPTDREHPAASSPAV